MNKRATEAFSVLTSGPLWVESPAVESGSVDPLGFQIEADRIAAKLLPGVTVFTTRARYLSFLCWALSHYEDDTAEIDRWEIALSLGEYLRHRDDGLRCSYWGKQLLTSRDKSGRLNGSERLPTRLYKQTARGLYGGLLRSCALVDESEELSPLGQKITAEFERDLPRRRPVVIWACARNLPCLSELRAREKRWLWEALLESNEDARKRLATLREVGGSRWRRILRERSPAGLLRDYLRPSSKNANPTQRHLYDAAKLEMYALPLTALFLCFYRQPDIGRLRPARHPTFHPFRLRHDDPEQLFSDVIAHLKRSSDLGSGPFPTDITALKDYLVETHWKKRGHKPFLGALRRKGVR